MNLQKEGRIKRPQKYTIEVIAAIIDQHNCTTNADLRAINEYAYKIARDNNWLEKLGLIENKHKGGYWTKDRVITRARLYTNKTDFNKNDLLVELK